MLVAVCCYLVISALESIVFFIKTYIQQIDFYIKIIFIVQIGTCARITETRKIPNSFIVIIKLAVIATTEYVVCGVSYRLSKSITLVIYYGDVFLGH